MAFVTPLCVVAVRFTHATFAVVYWRLRCLLPHTEKRKKRSPISNAPCLSTCRDEAVSKHRGRDYLVKPRHTAAHACHACDIPPHIAEKKKKRRKKKNRPHFAFVTPATITFPYNLICYDCRCRQCACWTFCVPLISCLFTHGLILDEPLDAVPAVTVDCLTAALLGGRTRVLFMVRWWNAFPVPLRLHFLPRVCMHTR